MFLRPFPKSNFCSWTGVDVTSTFTRPSSSLLTRMVTCLPAAVQML